MKNRSVHCIGAAQPYPATLRFTKITTVKITKGKRLAADRVDGLQTICLRPSKVASRQTEREQKMGKGDGGVQRA